jgi:transcriptional regulator with XRE-family HTH domain
MSAHYPEAAHYGDYLRRLREAQRLGLKVVAQKAGISFQHLARIEKGEINTPIGTLAKVAAALGITLDQLLGLARAASQPSGINAGTADMVCVPCGPYDVYVRVIPRDEPSHSFLFPRAWRIPGWPVRLALPPLRPALAYAG